MIGKLTGRFGGEVGRESGIILVDVSGVGYCVRVPPGVLAAGPHSPTPRRLGEEIELFIHTAVREDAIDLYGFPTHEELLFFKLLMSVSGVGPKTALGILTLADVAALANAIALGDAATLTKVYGIGKKNAERIVVELKDKLVHEQTLHGRSRNESSTPIDVDVLEALGALGYTSAESRAALSHIDAHYATLRERLAAALKHLGSVPERSS